MKLHRFSGTHYEIGLQQGQASREQIQTVLKNVSSFDVMKLMKPRLLPTSLFMTIAKNRAAKLLKNDVFEHYPKQAQRLKGIADGAETGIAAILFAHAMEMQIGDQGSYRIEACTTIALAPDCTATEETIVGKNFDYISDLEPYQLSCETNPQEGYATLGCKMSPLAGMLDGMNEHGLTVTYNLANTLDRPKYFAPLSLALQEMLETCDSTKKAVEFITRAKRGGHDAILTLADAEGEIATVEISSNHATTITATDDLTINTNHYKSNDMQRYEIPHNAVSFGKGVPMEHAGVRVHESSEQRLKRLRTAEKQRKNRRKQDNCDSAGPWQD